MTGTKIASAVMEAAPTVSPVATTGLANPPVVRVAFTRAATESSCTNPAAPPPRTVATTHVTSDGRSVTTAALARMPAPTAVGVQQPLPLELAGFALIDIAEVNHEAAGPRIRMHFEPRGERYEVRFHGIGTIREQRVDKGHHDGRVDRLRKRLPHRRPQQRLASGLQHHERGVVQVRETKVVVQEIKRVGDTSEQCIAALPGDLRIGPRHLARQEQPLSFFSEVSPTRDVAEIDRQALGTGWTRTSNQASSGA